MLVRIALLTAAVVAATTASASEVLYRYNERALFDGEFGHVKAAQQAINAALARCGIERTIAEDGAFGPGTSGAITELTRCAEFRDIGGNSSAVSGSLTRSLWELLLPGAPVPDPLERAGTLSLTFEQTDYTDAEWNFCQNQPFYAPGDGQPNCYSNDKRSFLTWGPRGATAGHGQEVFAILSIIDRMEPDLIQAAFAIEADAVRFAGQLSNAQDNSDLERFLCAIWLDPVRRSAWAQAFEQLGASPVVRAAYNELYRSSDYDGGKIERLQQVFVEAGFQTTYADLAFFADRAAHTSVSGAQIAQAREALAVGVPNTNAEARRVVALAMQVGNDQQRLVRLGRDVSYYVDELSGVLSAEEVSAWNSYSRVTLGDVGLDDSVLATFSAGPRVDEPAFDRRALTSDQDFECPNAVLNPLSPE